MNEITSDLAQLLKSDIVHRSILIIAAIIVIMLIVSLLKRAISKRVSDPDNKYRARKASTALGYLLIIIAGMLIFSDKLGDIGIALGLAGAGIAFALQEVIISVAGWINIILTSPVKIGQRIEVDGIRGDIIDIGVMKTTLMELGEWVDGDLYNGRITLISNSFVFKSVLRNYSADFPFLWDEITVPIRTESDFKRAQQIFNTIAEEVCGEFARSSQTTWNTMTNKFLLEDARVQPMVSMRFDENWITFTIRYVVDYKARRTTKTILFNRILEEVEKHEGIVMIGTSTLEVTTISASKN